MDARDIPWGDGSGSGDSGVALNIKVAEEIERVRVQREARRRLDAEERGSVTTPPMLTLRDRLARPRNPVRYRIEGWLPREARIMLSAQFKAGKTTLVGNLTRSLVDGDRFLGQGSVQPIDGALALFDTEMSGDQLDDWLEAQGIRNTQRVFIKAAGARRGPGSARPSRAEGIGGRTPDGRRDVPDSRPIAASLGCAGPR